MNKKLMMAVALGAITIGAGALTLSNRAGGETHGIAHTRLEPAAEISGWHDRDVLAGEGDGEVAFEAEAATGGSSDPALPSGPPATAAGDEGSPATSGTGIDAGPGGSSPAPENPGGPSSGAEDGPGLPPDGPGAPNPAPKPPVIFNPQANGAICAAMDCEAPELPFDPGLAEDICAALDCDGGEGGAVQPPVDPCALAGCPKPVLPLEPGKIIDVLRRL